MTQPEWMTKKLNGSANGDRHGYAQAVPRGATAVEYALITAGICIAIITAVNLVGSQLQTTFSTVSSDLQSAGK